MQSNRLQPGRDPSPYALRQFRAKSAGTCKLAGSYNERSEGAAALGTRETGTGVFVVFDEMVSFIWGRHARSLWVYIFWRDREEIRSSVW